MRSWPARVLTVVVLAGALPSLAMAQRPVRTTLKKDMTFPRVFPGVPVTVSPRDGVYAGAVDITGPNRAPLAVDIAVDPTTVVMSGPGGATMLMSFNATAAAYSQSGTQATATYFDPKVPTNVMLSNNGRGTIYIGGTLTPSTSQVAGTYTGTLTITVTY